MFFVDGELVTLAQEERHAFAALSRSVRGRHELHPRSPPRRASAAARLRPQDDRADATVLREGVARSATFSALVDRIEASNVIVYVAINPMLKSNLSGMLTWMTQRRRLPLRARVDQHRTDARSDDRHDRARAAARGGSDRRRSRQRRDEPGRALQAHRPAERQRVAIAAGKRTAAQRTGFAGAARARRRAGHRQSRDARAATAQS